MNLTRNDIAKLAGVSPSTVSRALSGSPLIPAETAERILEVARKAGYQPNDLARRLAFNRSLQLGFVLPLDLEGHGKGPLRMSYYSDILDGMVSASFKRGYRIVLNPCDLEGEAVVAKLVEVVRRREVDGLALLGLKQDSPIPSALLEASIPFVLIGSRSPGSSSVNWNQTQIAKTLVERLEAFGYERLIHVGGSPHFLDAKLQEEALFQAVAGTRFEHCETLEGDYSRASGYAAAELLWRQGGSLSDKCKTCVFLACDKMAAGFYNYCQEHAISIPRDIGVFGSDGDEISKVLHPKLSTAVQPRSQMGMAAAGMLMDHCEGKAVAVKEMECFGVFVEGGSL